MARKKNSNRSQILNCRLDVIAISRNGGGSSDIVRRFLGGHFNAENAKARRAAEDGLQSSRLKLTMQINRTADEHHRDFFLAFRSSLRPLRFLSS